MLSNSASGVKMENKQGVNVQVVVRTRYEGSFADHLFHSTIPSCLNDVFCRPLNAQEKKEDSRTVLSCNPKRKEISLNNKGHGKTYTFDAIYAPESTQVRARSCRLF